MQDMSRSPQPPGTLKRPPLRTYGSSSSSLSGLEQAAPSFRSFVKRTPSPSQSPSSDEDKPLPPTPLQPRRILTHGSEGSTWSPREFKLRRSSSIYSRWPSQWMDEMELSMSTTTTSDDLVRNPLPTLQPIAYSASTPQLTLRPKADPTQAPRPCQPLIAEPSPITSRDVTPPPPSAPEPPGARTSPLLPLPPPSAKVPKQHLRTVSLEKAKQAMYAPGAVHMLPEELRARTTGRGQESPVSSSPLPPPPPPPPSSVANPAVTAAAVATERARSQEAVRITSMDIFAGDVASDVPRAPVTLLDNHKRDRFVPTTRLPLISRTSAGLFQANIDGQKKTPGLAPVNTDAYHATRSTLDIPAGQVLAPGTEESRGRPRERAPRGIEADQPWPQKGRPDRMIPGPEVTALALANEYQALLEDRLRVPSPSPGAYHTDSDGSTTVKERMKMVPQPLFQKPVSTAPAIRGVDERRGSAQPSPSFEAGSGSVEVLISAGRLADEGLSRWSGAPPKSKRHRRRSTSGSIPISPPSFIAARNPPKPLLRKLSDHIPKATPKSQRRSSNDDRVSRFYPHVMARKQKSHIRRPPTVDEPEDGVSPKTTPGPKTPAAPPRPLHPDLSFDPFQRQHYRARSVKHEQRSEVGRTISGGSASHTDSTATPPPVDSSPSPGASPLQPVILGWSDKAKRRFDNVRLAGVGPLRRGQQQQRSGTVEHITTAARPLDERAAALAEPESPGGRRPSIFGSVLDGWRESKANKRRDDLKRLIKVVPPEQQLGEEPQLPPSPPPPPGGLARRESILRSFSSKSWRLSPGLFDT